MIRRLGVCLGALLLALPFLLAADPPGPEQPEPPLRLKKKPRPVDSAADKKPEDANKGTATEKPAGKQKAGDKEKGKVPTTGRKLRLPGDDDQPAGKDLQQEAAKALAEAAREMRESQDRLAKKDAGEGTQDIQRDILKRLDTLIKQQQQQDQQQQQQSQSSSANSRQQQNSRDRGGQQSSGRQRQTVQQRGNGQGNQPRATQADNSGRGGPDTKERMSKIADLYKGVWGSLPETLRPEMDQYSRERFMPKYDDLLKQYYARVAEKGRRKGQ
jgi:hypothetical protein